jgi:hypothetical protein
MRPWPSKEAQFHQPRVLGMLSFQPGQRLIEIEKPLVSIRRRQHRGIKSNPFASDPTLLGGLPTPAIRDRLRTTRRLTT